MVGRGQLIAVLNFVTEAVTRPRIDRKRVWLDLATHRAALGCGRFGALQSTDVHEPGRLSTRTRKVGRAPPWCVLTVKHMSSSL